MKELVFSSPYEVTAYEVYQGHLILEWPQRIDHNITAQVIHLANQINEKAKDGIQDIVPAYCSLGIFYTDHLSTESLIQLIKSIKINTHSVLKSSTKEIPVCYHPSLGIDIEYLCEVHSLTHKELIDLHSKPTYRVSFLGFLPGFLYLSGLKDQLITPRRAVPRTQLLPGSVGIGGNQTGIYPIESPGGWHIIGRTPLSLFDITNDPPSPFQAGDLIQFQSISLDEFHKLNSDA